MAYSEGAGTGGEVKQPAPVTAAPAERSETRVLLRWTIAAVCALWVLNLLTFWVALQQHLDAKQLRDAQVSDSQQLLQAQIANAKELLQLQTNLARRQLQVQTGIDLDREFNAETMQLLRHRFAAGLVRLVGIRDARKVHSIYDMTDLNINSYLNNFLVMDFFNKVGQYAGDGRLDEDTAYVEFSRQVKAYWPVCQVIVTRARAEAHDNNLYAGFENLYQLIMREDGKRRGGPAPPPPTAGQLNDFLNEEAGLVQER